LKHANLTMKNGFVATVPPVEDRVGKTAAVGCEEARAVPAEERAP
jgi:hypothetical protein